MDPATRDALVARLRRYGGLVEVGVGRNPAVARGLAAAGRVVVATDVEPRPVPEGVRFVVDDVTDPDPSVYRAADAVYALSLPPELHRPAREAARRADADLLFTTLGGDSPLVPVERESIPGDTLFVARFDGPG